jgi:UDP-glucose 4-epimerase
MKKENCLPEYRSIGSHTVVELQLQDRGYIIDNLSNSTIDRSRNEKKNVH